MSVRITMFLVVLATISVVAAFQLHSTPRESIAEPDVTRPLLFTPEELPAQQIDRISLKRRGERQLVFERGSGGWVQTAPFAHPLVAFSIDQVIEQARQLRVLATTLPAERSTPDFAASLSLDPPLATVEFSWTSDQGGRHSTSLALGRMTLGGRAYVQVAGQPAVHLVDHALHERLVSTDPKEWRDRHLFNLAQANVSAVSWTIGPQRLRIARAGKRWSMLEPAGTRADASRISSLLDALDRAVLSGFLVDEPEDLHRFGLEPPAASLSVSLEPIGTSEDSASKWAVQSLLIGQTIGVGSQDRFGMVEGRPVVVRVPAAALAALFPTKEALADPTACAVVPADVKFVTIVAGERTLELERDLERWIAPSQVGAEVSATLVDELLAHLTQLRSSHVTFEAFPRDRQVGRITLRGFAKQPLDTVRIARDPASGEWAMDNGDDVLRLYPPSLELRLTAEQFGLQPSTQ
jgi:hypothetical protein